LVGRGLVGKQLLLRAVAPFACESERRIAWMALFIER
jgi:hypothetical protein